MIREKEEDENVLGKVKCLKFERGDIFCELFGNEQEILKWRDNMCRILNQRGIFFFTSFLGFHT